MDLRQQKCARIILPLLVVFLLAITMRPAAAESNLSGKVLETMNSGGYTYVLLKTDDKEVWIAVTEISINVGDLAEFKPGMNMGEYTSPTLGRTFDGIIFSSGPVAIVPQTKKPDQAASAKPLDIAKAEGDNAFLIEELFAQKEQLDGKPIRVRGKVVKVSQYMGLTWLRLVDGSGSRKRGDHKLVVTTEATEAQKDEIVTIAGVLRKDKKVGMLDYDVLVEDAAVTINE